MIKIAGASVLVVAAFALLRILHAAFAFNRKIRRSSRLEEDRVQAAVGLRE
jgi:hypothetical protein